MKLLRFFSLIIFTLLLFTGCVQTHQEYFINEDGSGKVNVEATMVLNPKMMQGGQQEEGTTYEDKVKMVKKVREIINNSKGVEAWNNITYNLDEEGNLNFSGTAYFSSIQKFKLEDDIPTVPVPSFNKNGIRWAIKEQEKNTQESFEKEGPLDQDKVNDIVQKMQQEYKQASMMMSMVMNLFSMEAAYHFPYKIKSVKNIEQSGERSIKFEFGGDHIMKGFGDLMDDETRLKKLVKEEGIRKFNFEDPRILKAAYPDDDFMKATFRTGWFSPKARDPFNYEEEVAPLKNKKIDIPMPEKPEPPAPEIFTGLPSHHEIVWEIYKGNHGVTINQGKFALANNSTPSTVNIYDSESQSIIQSIEVNDDGLTGPMLEWNPENQDQILLTFGDYKTEQGTAKILDIKKGAVISEANFEGNPIDLTWIDNHKIAVVNDQGAIQIGALENNALRFDEPITRLVQPGNNFNAAKLDGYPSEKGPGLVSFDYNTGKIHIFQVHENLQAKVAKTLEIPDKGIPQDVNVATGNQYMALHLQGKMYLYKDYQLYDSLDVPNTTYKISWNPNGNKLYYLNKDGQLAVYDVQSKSSLILASDQEFIFYCLMDPTGRYLLMGHQGTPNFKLIKLDYN